MFLAALIDNRSSKCAKAGTGFRRFYASKRTQFFIDVSIGYSEKEPNESVGTA